MTTLQDDYFRGEGEENTSTKRYLLAWYIALHTDDWKSGKIGSGLLPDGPEGTLDIVNAHGREENGTALSIGWELKTGGLSRIDKLDHEGTAWLADGEEAESIRKAQIRLKIAVSAGIVPGSLSNDPKIAQFFRECGKSLCQVDLPDGIQLQIKFPTTNGVLIYRISGSDFIPKDNPTGDPALSTDNQFSEAAKESFKNVVSWMESGWIPKPARADSIL